jgi:tRNA1(Val) A37 N6-methylase TrmN6
MPASPRNSAPTGADLFATDVMQIDPAQTSEDAVLGGRLLLRQPRKGHRVGHDAILLAASCSAREGERLVDLGAGVGAAGLAVGKRVPDLDVTLVEIDPALAALAGENAARNGLGGRIRAVCLDVTAGASAFGADGLKPGTADHVLTNPPFNAAHNPSPDAARRLAHVAGDDAFAALAPWAGAAAMLLRPAGTLTLIWRADRLEAVLAVLGAASFGGIAVLPVHPKPQTAAIRVLVRAVKASNAPLSVLPGLVLADAAGKPSAEAEAVLRDGGVLPLAQAGAV